MTILEQRAATAAADYLPRIYKEIRRSNNLNALMLRLAIEQSRNGAGLSSERLKEYDHELEGVMDE